MTHDPIDELLRESGLDPAEHADLAGVLRSLNRPPVLPAPTPELASLLSGGVATPLASRRRGIATACAAAGLLLVGTGAAAASGVLPDPVQRFVADVTGPVLPVDLPSPAPAPSTEPGTLPGAPSDPLDQTPDLVDRLVPVDPGPGVTPADSDEAPGRDRDPATPAAPGGQGNDKGKGVDQGQGSGQGKAPEQGKGPAEPGKGQPEKGKGQPEDPDKGPGQGSEQGQGPGDQKPDRDPGQDTGLQQ